FAVARGRRAVGDDTRGERGKKRRRSVERASHNATDAACRIEQDGTDRFGELAALAADAAISPPCLGRRMGGLDRLKNFGRPERRGEGAEHEFAHRYAPSSSAV